MDRPAAAVRRDMRAMCADGAFFSVMVGAGETYLPAFALAVGMGEITAGLLAGVPLVAGAVVQLATPYGVRALRSHRRWVVACAILQALTFTPLVHAAFAGAISHGVLFGVAVAYWAFGMSTGPAWNTWVQTLVPRALAPRFFAARSRLSHVALLVGLLAGGYILDHAAERDQALLGFALVFFLAGLARSASALALSIQSEPVSLPPDYEIVPAAKIVGTLRCNRLVHLLGLMIALQLAVHIAAPYFTPYMLGELGLDYRRYMFLLAAALVAKAVFAPFAAQVTERLGNRRVLQLSAYALAPLPALWLVSHDFGYLFVLQVLSGFAWAAYELITLLLFFETIPAGRRTSILTYYNLANAVAIVVGTAIGGWILSHTATSTAAYAMLFAVSTVARLAAVLAFRRMELPAVHVVTMATRPLAVRPASGTLERPVLPSIPIAATAAQATDQTR